MKHIQAVIYAYFFITILLILKRLEKIIREKIKERNQKHKKYIYEEKIREEIERLKKKRNASREHIDFLQKELKKATNLYIFEDILTSIKKENPEELEKYCDAISPIFQILTTNYKEKNSIEKAYFMYVLLKFPSLMQKDENFINYAMMHFVFDKSIYARENAMLFFLRKGLEQPVVNSLKKISKRKLYYSSKLLTDDLLTFSGNAESLASLLLAEFNEFESNFQVAIINYLSLRAIDRKEEIHQKLMSRKYDKETELAMLRYFAHNKYTPALEILMTVMKEKDMFSYEYRIVSAIALGTYDTKETRKILINSLCDKNFYVRQNSALSLARMKIDINELKNTMKTDDKFAKDMVEYIWQEKYQNNKAKKKNRKKKGLEEV